MHMCSARVTYLLQWGSTFFLLYQANCSHWDVSYFCIFFWITRRKCLSEMPVDSLLSFLAILRARSGSPGSSAYILVLQRTRQESHFDGGEWNNAIFVSCSHTICPNMISNSCERWQLTCTFDADQRPPPEAYHGWGQGEVLVPPRQRQRGVRRAVRNGWRCQCE